MKYNRILMISVDCLSREYQYLFQDYFNEIYTNYKTTSSWTLPSHFTMLTGFSAPRLYDVDLNYLNNYELKKYKDFLKNVPTIATYLKQQGFKTKAFTGSGYMAKYFGWGHDFDEWKEVKNVWIKTKNGEQHWRGQKIIPDKNEFIFIHTYYVHQWCHEIDNYQAKVKAIINNSPQKAQIIKEFKKAYKKRIELIAKNINWIKNLSKNTLVILTSDHADLFYEDSRSFGHGQGALQNGKIFEVPLLIKDQGKSEKIDTHFYDLNLLSIILQKLEIPFKTPREQLKEAYGPINELAEIKKSYSWRLTSPFRKINWAIKHPKKAIYKNTIYKLSKKKQQKFFSFLNKYKNKIIDFKNKFFKNQPKYFQQTDNLKIAMATICIGKEYKKKMMKGIESKIEYCKKNGYTFLYADENSDIYDKTRPASWSKINLIKKHLYRYDYIFWSDPDVIIKNHNIKLELLIKKYQKSIAIILTKDAVGNINMGNFFIKNCRKGRKLLKLIYKQKQFINHNWWENIAFIHLYKTKKSVQRMSYIEKNHWLFNAYINPGGESNNFERPYKEGDFLIHFVWKTKNMMNKY